MAVRLKELLDVGKERLALKLISGEEYLDRTIDENAINRPGLALTGFFHYFAERRFQVFGLAEFTYLENLSAQEREERLRALLEKNVPGIVIARNRQPFPELRDLAKEYKTPLFRTSLITSHFINEWTVLIEELSAPRGRLAGTMLDIMGIGVLLQGKAGIGKSEIALSLIERGYSLVSDDITEVVRKSHNRIETFANEVTRYHMEIRGVGIVHIPSLFGMGAIRRQSELDIIINLHSYESSDEADRDGNSPREMDVLGLRIPFYDLPVSPGRDMANLVETTALNHKLKLLGHDAAKELDEKVIGRFLAQSGG